MTRTEELLALAEAATPGPWNIENDSLVNRGFEALDETDKKWDIGEIYHDDNINFIAAANPETIKQLVELAVLQNEALKASMGMMDQYSYRATLRGDKGYDTLRIVEAFERFEKGGESIGITLPPAS